MIEVRETSTKGNALKGEHPAGLDNKKSTKSIPVYDYLS